MFLQLLGYIWLNLSMSRSVLQTRLSASIDACQKWCLSWLPQIWTPSIHLHSGRIGEWPIVIIERDKKSSQNSLVHNFILHNYTFSALFIILTPADFGLIRWSLSYKNIRLVTVGVGCLPNPNCLAKFILTVNSKIHINTNCNYS